MTAVTAMRELRRNEPEYPQRLHELRSPPERIWARGDLALLDRPCVAIVGTRRATEYAERITAELARTLARAGASVISGLARGVDAAAHRGALEVDGATCAVLGTGLDVAYPKGHASLQSVIGRRGLLLSEIEPTSAAHRGSFPQRNRIIAALASVTIVVEAGFKSGALLTAKHADDIGRTVAAVPGPIDVPQAQGSNELLRDGATVIATLADAVALMGLTAPVRRVEYPEGSSERRMWDTISAGAADLDTLCSRSGLPVEDGMAAVTTLEMHGLIECGLTGEIRRR